MTTVTNVPVTSGQWYVPQSGNYNHQEFMDALSRQIQMQSQYGTVTLSPGSVKPVVLTDYVAELMKMACPEFCLEQEMLDGNLKATPEYQAVLALWTHADNDPLRLGTIATLKELTALTRRVKIDREQGPGAAWRAIQQNFEILDSLDAALLKRIRKLCTLEVEK